MLMRLSSLLTATALSLPLLFSAAHAEDYLNLNAGKYDALRNKYPSALFGAEYRFSDISYGVHPLIGGFANTHGGMYGYGGFNWMVPIISNQLYIVPNFAAGLYRHGSRSDRDLGGPIEFRSGIELDYQFNNGHQIGVALNHLSNAHIYSDNPGEENIIVNYSIPVSTVAGMFRSH